MGLKEKLTIIHHQPEEVKIRTLVDNNLAIKVSSLFCTVTSKALQSSSRAPCLNNKSTKGTSLFLQASTRAVE